jgi:hypothetical protein
LLGLVANTDGLSILNSRRMTINCDVKKINLYSRILNDGHLKRTHILNERKSSTEN